MRAGTRLVILVLLCLLSLASVVWGQTMGADRASIGGTKERPETGTTLRVQGLATSGGTDLLFLDAEGDARRRLLVAGDVPSTFTQRTVAEAISQAWAFNAGLSATSGTFSTTLGVTGLSTLTGGFSAGTSSSIAGNLSLTGTGSITAAGDVAANGGDLTSTGALIVRPTGNLTLDPTGDVVMGPDGADVLPSSGYAVNLGALATKYLSLHAAELWVETLVAQDTLATIGGRVLVAPTTLLTADLAPAATTITVKHNNLANGDRVYMEANGAVEFMAVTSAAGGSAGAYTYSVTRNLDGSGANQWYAGDALLNTGTTGSGFIDLYSVRGVKSASEAGPTIVGNVRNSATWNDWGPRWAVGNLNGLYGYATNEYGAAFGASAGQHITVEPTNGIRFRSSTTTWAQLSASGLALGVTAAGNGNLFADTSGNLFLRSGTVTRMTMAAANGTMTFHDPAGVGRIGVSSDYIRFYGTDGAMHGYIGGTGTSPDIVLGSTASGENYFAVNSSGMSFCVAGTGCSLSMDGTTGNFTMFGTLALSGSGTVTSSGNWSITPSSGLSFTGNSTYLASRSVSFLNSSIGARLWGYGSGNDGVLFLETKPSSYTGGIKLSHTNSTAQLDAEFLSSGIGSLVQVTKNSINSGYLGTSGNPWTRVYATNYYAGTLQGYTGQMFLVGYGGGTCQVNYTAGLITSHNCPTTFP